MFIADNRSFPIRTHSLSVDESGGCWDFLPELHNAETSKWKRQARSTSSSSRRLGEGMISRRNSWNSPRFAGGPSGRATVSQLMGADGQPDPEKIAFHYIELEKAISEAEAYVRQTREMVQCLLERLR